MAGNAGQTPACGLATGNLYFCPTGYKTAEHGTEAVFCLQGGFMKTKDRVILLGESSPGFEVRNKCPECGGTVYSYWRADAWSWESCRGCGHSYTTRSLGISLAWIDSDGNKDPAKLKNDLVRAVDTMTGIDISDLIEGG